MIPSRARSSVVVALALFLAALASWAATGGARPGDALTLEDVVRLHVSGMGDEELIARIRAAQVDFDLSEPMLEELRIAGLGERVIQAMLARQVELHPPPPPPAETAEPEPASASSTLVVRPHVGRPGARDEASPPLRVTDTPPPELLQRLGLDAQSRIEDLALWVGCVTPTHVPDHWRSESRLGRDFEATPRHQLLGFVSGAARENAGARSAALSLTVPERIPVEIDPAEPHQIVIGVAVQIAGRFYTMGLSSRIDVAPAATPREIEAWIVARSPDPRSIEVQVPQP